MLQTVHSQRLYLAYDYQPYTKSALLTPPSSILSSENGQQHESILVTPFQFQTKTPGQPDYQGHEGEMWPEIESIIRKIRWVEGQLISQRKITSELSLKVKVLEASCKTDEQQRICLTQKSHGWEEKSNSLETRVRQLEGELAERQQLLANIQYGSLQKSNQNEQKIRKLNTDAKELTDKLRKANIQVEKQRKNNQQLRESMATQLEQIQSQRDSFLNDQLQRIRELFESSKEQRERLLYDEIDQLKRTLYQREQEIKRKDIEIALADRKKQQAVSDIAEKKDQELKVQKTLSKALNQKIGKLQEEIKALKTHQIVQIQRTNSRKVLRSSNRSPEEEVSFELTPEKK